MKRKERHHLKENELVHSIAAARDFVELRRRQVTTALVLIALFVVAIAGIVIVRRQMQSRGQDLLAEAMVALNARVVPAGTPTQGDDVPAAATLGATGTFATEEAKLNAALPKLKAAADAYPDSTAGITARYHMGGALAALGRHKEAIEAFDQVTTRAGANSLYGRMSQLGRADAQAQAGELDAAIATWKELVSRESEELPVDAILIELARAYVQKGDIEEARKTFTQIVDQHPDSQYSVEARAELDNLKS